MFAAPVPLIKRLLPLYAAVFLQGFVLWYAIEKLFMRRIGFDDAGIGIMVAAYSAVMLLIETPSGILADRWSRKGVLMLASIAMAASSIVGGISQGIPMYLVCAALWGVFFALHSGTFDSVLYDALLEADGNSKKYERYYGRLKMVDSLALVLGSVLGGLLAAKFGLRAAYFWTVPLALLTIVALTLFKEPKLHKAHADAAIGQHVRRTFAAVLQKGHVLYILTVLVILSALSYGLFEFSQLWWIALAVPVFIFGPANGLLLGTIGLGGFAASRLKLHRYRAVQATLLTMLLAAAVLALWRSAPVAVICQLVVSTGAIGLIVVFNRLLHDTLPSQVRAGASSAVSTLTRVLLIPLSLLFGYISRQVSVFVATWVFVVLLAAAMVVVSRMFTGQSAAPATARDELDVEEYQK